MTSKEYEHLDAIGRPLKMGDPVAVPKNKTQLMIGRITGYGEKMIRVVEYGKDTTEQNWKGKIVKAAGKLRYPGEAVLLDGPEITMHLLKFAQRNDK